MCDHKRRFLDINIAHPVSASNYLAFGTSLMCKLLETPGFLAKGVTTYGDNAYFSSPYTISPFKAISSGPRDAYNFYHSQIRINIEYAFGMLINRWALLRTPIPINISIKNQHHWYGFYVVFTIGLLIRYKEMIYQSLQQRTSVQFLTGVEI